MKPQLIIQELKPAGDINADLGLKVEQLKKQASWKKQRIVVILPAGKTIASKVALTHWNLGFPPNNMVVKMLAIGAEVGEAYSSAIESILAHPDLKDFEYVLTIEHDNMPPPWGVMKLIEDMEEHPEYDCIGGLYFLKGYGAAAQIWGDPKDKVLNFRPQLPDPNGGLVECNGTGMGFNLWRLKMFKDKKLRKPWFKTIANETGSATQDLYFWADAKKHGYRCAIDCSIRVGHYDLENDIVY